MNRQFLSVARVIPTLGVEIISFGVVPNSMCNSDFGSFMSAPLSKDVMFKACVSLPGPEPSEKMVSTSRYSLMTLTPSIGSIARIRTAPAISLFDLAETFTQ